MHLDLLPIVHAGALRLRVLKAEAEPANQVERYAGGSTKPGNRARIGGDFGFEKGDLDGFSHPPATGQATRRFRPRFPAPASAAQA